MVAALLRTFGTSCLRLVDVSSELPSLRRRAGLCSWSVWHRGGWHADWEGFRQKFWERTPPLESLFPPTEDEAAAMQLHRCVRLLPHDVNGSGFFVAVLEKVAEHAEAAGAIAADEPEVCVVDSDGTLPAVLFDERREMRAADRPPNAEGTEGAAGAPEGGLIDEAPSTALPDGGEGDERRNGGDGDEGREGDEGVYAACARHAAVLHAVGGATIEAAAAQTLGTSYPPLFTPAADLIERLQSFFGTADGFPSARLVARSPSARQLLLVTDEVLGLLRADSAGALRVVHTGVRIFEREEAKGCDGCGYRVCQDGLPHVLRFQRRQLVGCETATAARILRSSELLTPAVMADEDPTLAAALQAHCRPGSIVLACTAADGLPLHMVGLYAPSGALGHRIKPLERQALLVRLGVAAGNHTGLGNSIAGQGDAAAEGVDHTAVANARPEPSSADVHKTQQRMCASPSMPSACVVL